MKYVSVKNVLISKHPLISLLFSPSCCSICSLQSKKPWTLRSPPLCWMMLSTTCGRRMLPPLLMRCPNSRTGMGMRKVAMGTFLPPCLFARIMPEQCLYEALGFPSRGAGDIWQEMKHQHNRLWYAGRLWVYTICWFLSESQGLSQELYLTCPEMVMPGEIIHKVLQEVLSHY